MSTTKCPTRLIEGVCADCKEATPLCTPCCAGIAYEKETGVSSYLCTCEKVLCVSCPKPVKHEGDYCPECMADAAEYRHG